MPSLRYLMAAALVSAPGAVNTQQLDENGVAEFFVILPSKMIRDILDNGEHRV